MKPIIILEGVDGAGKTTLARVLCKRLGAVYTHHSNYPGVRPGALARLYHETMLPALNGIAPVVLDRAWLSEPIYGAVFRSGADRVQFWRRMLERVLLSVPHLVVYVRPSFEQAWRIVSDRAHDELAKRREQLERLYGAYESTWPRWGEMTMLVDRERQPERTPDDWADAVLTYAARDFDQCRGLNSWGRLQELGAIGNLNPAISGAYTRVLLVGDAPSARASTAYPFVNHDLGGCSAWLAAYLERHEIDENRLVWMNAYDLESAPTRLKDVAELLGAPIIALGSSAHGALDQLGLDHVTVPHPQWVKRFQYETADQEYDLAMNIKERL